MPRPLQNALIAALLHFLLPGAKALAAPACESAASLRAKVKDCEGNLAYATAGKRCLDDFDAAVNDARGRVAQALSAVIASDRQSQSMANAKKGYQTAIASLGALADQGRRLGRDVLAYKGEIVFPDDFGAAGQAGLSSNVFLDNQQCYSSTRKLVITYAELLGLHAQELDLTKKVAEVLAAKAFRGESHLKPEEVLPLLTNPEGLKGQGAGPGKGNRNGKGPSDITGTDKKKDAPVSK